MKRFTKTAMLGAAVGAVLVSQSAQAQFTVNDLYLGFTKSTASSDIIIDLGQASSLIADASVKDLSVDLGGLSTFNSTFSSSANGVAMAVIGGNNNNTVNPFGLFATQFRNTTTGPLNTPSVAGSSLSTKSTSSAAMSGGANVVGGLAAGGLPTAGNSLSDPNKTYFAAEQNGSGTFVGKTGINPTGTGTTAMSIGSTGVLYEDLYAAVQGGKYTYEGFFTFNYGNDLLTFTPNPNVVTAAVPEPGTYGVIAAAGLLVISLRRQLGAKAS